MRRLGLTLILLALGCRQIHEPLSPDGSVFRWRPTVVDTEGVPLTDCGVSIQSIAGIGDGHQVQHDRWTDQNGRIEVLLESGRTWRVAVRPSFRHPVFVQELVLSSGVDRLTYALQQRRTQLRLDLPGPSNRKVEYDNCRVRWIQPLPSGDVHSELADAIHRGSGAYDLWYHDSFEFTHVDFVFTVDEQRLNFTEKWDPRLKGSFPSEFPMELAEAGLSLRSTTLEIGRTNFLLQLSSAANGATGLSQQVEVDFGAPAQNVLFREELTRLSLDSFELRGSLLPIEKYVDWADGGVVEMELDGYVLQIEVSDPALRPLPRVYVEIQSVDDSFDSGRETDLNGSAEFLASPGLHAIRIFDDVLVEETVVEVQDNTTVPIVLDLAG